MKTKGVRVTSNDLRKASLDLLRFPLAVVVVIVHVFGSGGTSIYSYALDNYAIFRNVNLVIDAFLRGISVPIYFFISGYVFFYNTEFNSKVYVNKIKNRIKTLLIPYAIWNTIAILLIIIKQLPVFSDFLTSQGTTLNLSLENILSCYWAYNGKLSTTSMLCNTITKSPFPINTALWFIRDLMIVVLTTPVLHILIKRMKQMFVLVIFILYLLIHIFFPVLNMLSTAYLFFSMGAWICINNIDMIKLFRYFFLPSGMLYVIVALIYCFIINDFPEVAKMLKYVNIFTGVVFFFNISSWLLDRGICSVNRFLSSASFFIYLSHCLIVHRMTKILLRVISPCDGISVTMTYGLSVVITILTLLWGYYLLKRFAPRLLTIITGRK